MIESRNIPLATVPLGGMEGAVWLRLHGEREDICESLLRTSQSDAEGHRRQEVLQARLREIDEALDQLMSRAELEC